MIIIAILTTRIEDDGEKEDEEEGEDDTNR